MKVPSFIKLPRYRRFNYTPNYYDAVAEARKQRQEGRQKGKKEGRIMFRRRAQRQQEGTGMFRLVTVLVFLSMVLGYVWYGSWVFYGLFPALYVLGVYIYVRRKRKRAA